MHGECKRFVVLGCKWRRDRGYTPHTRGNKGEKVRAGSKREEEKERERRRETERKREKERAVICHGKRPFSQYYFPQSVINCAHISPFSTASLLLLFPFRSVAAPFLFLIVNSARSFRRLSARRHA